MKRRKQRDGEPEIAPLEQELAAAEGAAETGAPEPSASADELASASLFTDEAEPVAAHAETEPPADPQALAAELADLRARNQEYLDGWQRARAEFANYKKRIEREQGEGRARAAASVLTRLLPVVDDLLLALRDRPNGDGAARWADGIELISRKLQAVLDAEGVEEIPAEGAFDPELHEAVTHEDSPGHAEGQIIEVIQPGYRLGERVLRPARVRVAR